MKSGIGGSTYSLPAKRRWRLVIGVLVLVMLSMLVHFVFLLGFHNTFHSTGYVSEQSSPTNIAKDIVQDGDSRTASDTKDGKSRHIDEVLKRLTPIMPKDAGKNLPGEVEWEMTDTNVGDARKKPPQEIEKETTDFDDGDVRRNSTEIKEGAFDSGVGDDGKSVSRDFGKEPIISASVQHSPRSQGISKSPELPRPISDANNTPTSEFQVTKNEKGAIEESEKSCEVKYGSYCLWRRVHREEMKDAMVKKLKDQLFVARAYYPSVAKLPNHDKLTRELKQNIQELERIFSEASTDADLPPEIEKKSQRMEAVIAKSKAVVLDCANVEKKLRQLVDLTEDESNFHMKQSAFLFQISVQTMPKSHHCLFMRLTVEYFKTTDNVEVLLDEKYMNPRLHHYVILSQNILAASTVINSTVMHAKDTSRQVFHVLTDKQNYFAMKLWFYKNKFKEAAVEVLNIEDLELVSQAKASLQLSLPEEFRISFRPADSPPTSPMKTDYLSVFSHSHYLLPEIFHYLKKIVVLDDDVVVKQDLSALWNLNMKGKVNGAVQSCRVRLGQLKGYLGMNDYDESSCAWMSGLNIIDLVRWRELNITRTYQNLLHKVNQSQNSDFCVIHVRSIEYGS
uniref:Hexosyltransferase n=1 Tax=Kalanchoe fedtschenkoi TaxID=63787 RepID=A0A7N0V9D3_KALFE